MNVCLDTTVLLADPWQESEKTRALYDYISKTRGSLLIHDVVLQEATATMERRWREAIRAYNGAAGDLSRLRLSAIPAADEDQLVAATRDAWEKSVRRIQRGRRTIQTEPALMVEIVRRATQRIPPCARRGEGFRDALLWLGTLDFCNANDLRHLAFISSNTRDYAGADGALLPALEQDAVERNITVDYYSSVEAFLKEHAEPIAWLNLEWVEQRIDQEEVAELLWDTVAATELRQFRLKWHDGEGWNMLGHPEVQEVSETLEDLYIWEYDGNSATVFLTYAVNASAQVTCERESMYSYGPPDEPPEYYTERERLLAEVDLLVEIAAEVRENTVQNLSIDSVDRA